jgi:hypothetical protein
MNLKMCLACAAASLVGPAAQAAIVYSTAGSNYTQDFDTLPITPSNATLGNSPIGWVDDSTSPGVNQFSIPGFYLYHPLSLAEGGANGNQRVRVGAGTANTGSMMSWGTLSNTDRALGALVSNTLAPAAVLGPPAVPAGVVHYGARFTNNTGAVLTQFTLSYTGEQWRDGGSPPTPNVPSLPQGVTFDYKLNAASIQDTGYTAVPTLGFIGPQFGATTQDTSTNVVTNQNDRDGNQAANRVVLGPVTVTGLNWLPGDDLWIRWNDVNDAGNDHGLGIDDLTFSAIPEPSTFGLAGLAAIMSLAVRRRN